MACCGSQRIQLQANSPSHPVFSAGSANTHAEAPARRFVVCFEYVGQTGLTAIGGVTGRRYRFDRPGARIIVDPRDRPSMATVPNLRQV